MANNNKYSFGALINTFDKIEIPIIQRDYAQGRENEDVNRIRNKFIKKLIETLTTGNSTELDFVYGNEIETNRNNTICKIFIPLDGQQRLTTLFLLHWFIAVKENKIEEIRHKLLKFTYETRPSTHSFCKKLIMECDNIKFNNLKENIIDSIWFDPDWGNDPTISGMLVMLDTFACNEKLVKCKVPLFEKLIDETNPIIYFYFISLNKMGLSDDIYIRMNARGKQLTPFENFKSDFSTIINYNENKLEDFKDKIEYKWVENLWQYRNKNEYTIDMQFMQILRYISEMLYFKHAEFHAEEYKQFDLDYIYDHDHIKPIYSEIENLDFLFNTLDVIEEISNLNNNILFDEKTSIKDILVNIINGKEDVSQKLLMYAILKYRHKYEFNNDFNDYVRVVRNLIYNTNDKSQREWPRLLKSIENLITDKNIYLWLLEANSNDKMIGFYQPQRNEEIFKAKLISNQSITKSIILKAEDNNLLQGNILGLIQANYSKAKDFTDYDINSLDVNIFNYKKFENMLKAYEIISSDDFNPIWGDLINSTLYTQDYFCRLKYDINYKKHHAIFNMVIDFYYWSIQNKSISLIDFIIVKEKEFIQYLQLKNYNFVEISNVKQQLYLYYIYTVRIQKKDISTFFKDGCYNFGWLTKRKGYVSRFRNGIKNDVYFENSNPIFQTYSSQFRYNLGLKSYHCLDIEQANYKGGTHIFEKLILWSLS